MNRSWPANHQSDSDENTLRSSTAVSDSRTPVLRESEPFAAPHNQHFRTEHLVQNLGKRAISGGVVTAAAQTTKFVLNLTSAVVLARLLSPEEFGVVGMVLAVTALFRETGLSTATVQKETITQEQVSNLFWINLGLSGLIALICVCLAPAISVFYRDSRLFGVMVALAFTFLLTGSAVQHNALLVRQMRFRAIAMIEVSSMLAGIGIACSMAFSGFGYWSLVGMQLGVAATALVLTWWASGWRPALPTRNSGVGSMLKFGAHVTASDLVGRLAAHSDSILVGRFFGAEPLGLYTRANALLARPLEQLLSPVTAVLIPVLSRLQTDPVRYRHTFLCAYDVLAMITFPFAALCLVLSEPLVLLLLGSEWEGAVPLFAAFALVAVSLPPSVSASWLLLSQGRGRDLLRTYSVLGAITVAAFVAGLRWGPLGVVMALAIVSLFIRMPILYYVAGRFGPVRTSDLWTHFLQHLPCWGVVCIVTALTRSTVREMPLIMQLLVCVPMGIAAAAAGILALSGPRGAAAYVYRTVRHSWSGQLGGVA